LMVHKTEPSNHFKDYSLFFQLTLLAEVFLRVAVLH